MHPLYEILWTNSQQELLADDCQEMLSCRCFLYIGEEEIQIMVMPAQLCEYQNYWALLSWRKFQVMFRELKMEENTKKLVKMVLCSDKGHSLSSLSEAHRWLLSSDLAVPLLLPGSLIENPELERCPQESWSGVRREHAGVWAPVYCQRQSRKGDGRDSKSSFFFVFCFFSNVDFSLRKRC